MIPKLKTSDGRVIPLAALIRIEPENLIPEYELQAPWTAVLQYEYGILELLIEKKEREIKETESELFISVRDRLRLGTRAPNEATIKATVASDQQMKDLYQELFALKEKMIPLNAARVAFNVRKDMLVSLGAEVRLDKKSQ